MVPVLLSLPLLLGPAVFQETGSYSLTFLYTGLSRPSKGFPRFQATAFLNDQAFFHYNSNSGKAEPVGPWSQVEGMEDWEKESQLQRAREEIFLVTLKDIMDYYKDTTDSKMPPRLETRHVGRWLASTDWRTNVGLGNGRGRLEEALLICSSMEEENN